MHYKILLVMIFILAVSPASQAETVILKNGTAVEGNIIEKDGQKIKIDVSGVLMTYYMDEIEVIDGVAPSAIPNPPSETAPEAAPVEPVVSPEPSAVPADVAIPAGPVAPSTPSGLSKKDLISRFIDVFGTRSSLTQNFDALVKSVSPAQAPEIRKALNVDEIINELVPIYDKYFTQEELEAYVNFYSSPEGKKLVETIPHVMTDSVGVSLKYFKAKLPNIPVKEAK